MHIVAEYASTAIANLWALLDTLLRHWVPKVHILARVAFCAARTDPRASFLRELVCAALDAHVCRRVVVEGVTSYLALRAAEIGLIRPLVRAPRDTLYAHVRLTSFKGVRSRWTTRAFACVRIPYFPVVVKVRTGHAHQRPIERHSRGRRWARFDALARVFVPDVALPRKRIGATTAALSRLVPVRSHIAHPVARYTNGTGHVRLAGHALFFVDVPCGCLWINLRARSAGLRRLVCDAKCVGTLRLALLDHWIPERSCVPVDLLAAPANRLIPNWCLHRTLLADVI